MFVSFVYGSCKVFLTFVSSGITVTNYKLSKQPDFAVMTLLVVSVSESGKCRLFWIVYNNYFTKALLNSFELYLSIIRA